MFQDRLFREHVQLIQEQISGRRLCVWQIIYEVGGSLSSAMGAAPQKVDKSVGDFEVGRKVKHAMQVSVWAMGRMHYIELLSSAIHGSSLS